MREFAASDLPGRLHEALLDRTLEGHLADHVSRDSTAIPGRESPAPKPAPTAKPKRRRGRPRQDEPRPKEPRRLERQASMTLEEMLEDLPKVCDSGVKRNAKGYQESWTGYKLHIDAIDGGIPVSCLLTSASVHDSQAAIPALEPESGPAGTEVVVRGENFGPSIGAVQGTSGMSFDGVWGAPAYWSEAEIRWRAGHIGRRVHAGVLPTFRSLVQSNAGSHCIPLPERESIGPSKTSSDRLSSDQPWSA